jgi:hypothetical protein
MWFWDLSPTCFFYFFLLNMSPYVHAFAMAPSSFLYMVECRSAAWVCAQSRDVFITACMTMENWRWFVLTCFTWLKWLRAEDLINLIHACMHSEARVALLRGWIQRLPYIYTCIAYQGKNVSVQKLYSACIHACMYCEARMGLCPALVHGACIAFPSPLGIQREMLTTTKSEAWPVHFGNVPTGASWHEILQLPDVCSDVT